MPEQLEILKSRMAWKQMTEQSIHENDNNYILYAKLK